MGPQLDRNAQTLEAVDDALRQRVHSPKDKAQAQIGRGRAAPFGMDCGGRE